MKMYKKPMTEVTNLKTASLMQDLTVSVNESGTPSNGGNPNPTAGMPKRGSVIP